MKINKINIGIIFLLSALLMLVLGLCFGLLAATIYIYPDFLKQQIGFISLRPLHVSSAMFWIILGATGCIYNGMKIYITHVKTKIIGIIQWILWLVAIAGIITSYFIKDFGGREYWEFNAVWALPIAMAWILFLINFSSLVYKIKNWPVYIWMWLTGILFFLFTFTENYLYGTAIFLMDKISNTKNSGRSKFAFFMYFLGLFNLMFNWGHHIYTLPTEKYIRYIGYIVSMTEWAFFIKIVYDWKSSINTIQKHYHYFPYRFIMAADIWVFINMGQAILMSIPAINIYTHGTHVTVAHAMGTTIGINSMILLAACFEFLNFNTVDNPKKRKYLNVVFWALQLSLLIFWLSLNIAGIQKGIWQLSLQQISYSKMMASLTPYFISFVISGLGLMITLSAFAFLLIKSSFTRKNLQKQ